MPGDRSCYQERDRRASLMGDRALLPTTASTCLAAYSVSLMHNAVIKAQENIPGPFIVQERCSLSIEGNAALTVADQEA